MKDPREIIIRPVISEKGTNMLVENKNTGRKYVFEVDRKATKIDIKNAIKEIFNVNVVSVATLTVHGKTKRLGRFLGKRRSWKKAIVTLKKGQEIAGYGET